MRLAGCSLVPSMSGPDWSTDSSYACLHATLGMHMGERCAEALRLQAVVSL